MNKYVFFAEGDLIFPVSSLRGLCPAGWRPETENKKEIILSIL
jgi:hypothetical protein